MLQRSRRQPDSPAPASRRRAPLSRQSQELVGYLDTLSQGMMQKRAPGDSAMAGCSREDFRALMVLFVRADCRMGELAEALGVPLSTATHTVGRLVKKGLAVRYRPEQDRRVVRVALGEAGERMQTHFREKRLETAHSWLASLRPAERETFLGLMNKIARLAKPPAAPAE